MEHSYNSTRGVNKNFRLLKWEQPKGSQDFILHFEITSTWHRLFFGKVSHAEKVSVRGSGTVWHTWPDGIRLESSDEHFVTRHFQQRVKWDLEEIQAESLSGIAGLFLKDGVSKTYDPELLMIEKLKDDSKLTSSK